MSAAPRSGFVTGLAWTFIGLAGFATLIAALQNLMLFLVFPIEEMRAAAKEANEAHGVPAGFGFMFEHMWLLFVLFLLVSATTLVSAIGLLKRWNWARLAFIGVMALGVLWNLGSLAMPFFMTSWMPVPEQAPPDFLDAFDVIWKIMTVVTILMGLAFAGLFGWIIKRLVSPQIRAEFGR